MVAFATTNFEPCYSATAVSVAHPGGEKLLDGALVGISSRAGAFSRLFVRFFVRSR